MKVQSSKRTESLILPKPNGIMKDSPGLAQPWVSYHQILRFNASSKPNILRALFFCIIYRDYKGVA